MGLLSWNGDAKEYFECIQRYDSLNRNENTSTHQRELNATTTSHTSEY